MGPDFDLDEAIKTLVGESISAEPIDLSPSTMFKLRDAIRSIGPKLKSQDPAKLAQITEQDWNKVKKLLWSICNIDQMTPELNNISNLNVENTLKAISDEKWKFPIEYRNIAQALLESFELQNWGKEVAVESDGKESSAVHKGAKGSKSPSTPSSKAKKQATSPSEEAVNITRPSANHSIFGANGPMHHILIKKGASKSYLIDPEYLQLKKSSKVFGANDLEVGAWWPLQIAALRDGAHGERQAGISGSAKDGARSVVVSGHYHDFDHDNGGEILYSSAQGEKLDAEAMKENHGVKALLRSIETQSPVRVLRGAGAKWSGAPQCGFRYDGLYQVEGCKEVSAGSAGSYLQFRLLRIPGQDPINQSKPTMDQVRQFEKVMDGY